MAESAIDPDQGTLVVLQVEDHGALDERTRLDDQVELVVDQPRRALRHNIDAHPAQRVKEPVPAGVKQNTPVDGLASAR